MLAPVRRGFIREPLLIVRDDLGGPGLVEHVGEPAESPQASEERTPGSRRSECAEKASAAIASGDRGTYARLQAIRDDRFVEEYEAFKKLYPENELGSHEIYGYTITIRFFDDRSETYRNDFLKKDGLKAYVGIHVYNEAQSEVRYPHPYLFQFFGVKRLDATGFYRGTPYNPIDNGIPGRSHPQADLSSARLPDISAAGHRDGGLAYYVSLEHRNRGWTFECPGFYPHDGKTVATELDPALLQFGGYTVTHSRPR